MFVFLPAATDVTPPVASTPPPAAGVPPPTAKTALLGFVPAGLTDETPVSARASASGGTSGVPPTNLNTGKVPANIVSAYVLMSPVIGVAAMNTGASVSPAGAHAPLLATETIAVPPADAATKHAGAGVQINLPAAVPPVAFSVIGTEAEDLVAVTVPAVAEPPGCVRVSTLPIQVSVTPGDKKSWYKNASNSATYVPA
jgi:hypothetical protein